MIMDYDVLTIFFGGIATVFTPCILPVLPVYLGIFTGSAANSVARRFNVFFQTLYFGAGFTLIFTGMGLSAATLSNIITSNKSFITFAGAIIIIFMGFVFSGTIKINILMREYRLGENIVKGNGVFASFFSGVVFAAGWSPCAGPVLGSVLTYVALKSTGVIKGGAMMAIYSLGILTPFLILSLLTDKLLPKIRQTYRYLPIIQKTGGVLLIIGGLILISSEFHYIKSVFTTKERAELSEKYPVSGSPRMLFVFSRDCPECKKLHSIMPRIRDDCKGMQIEINEIYVEDEPVVRQKLGINTYPTIILFDAKGSEVKRVFGSRNLTDLRVAAASLINQKCAGESPDIERVHSTDMRCSTDNTCEEKGFAE
ncbi:MAG: thiol:disulfide interchange protein DsbD [Deltaproteobacteria bacterium]|nr:thiol:disulfide interchange protein DsbD [Deltaproteobacteria bacterium]